MTQRNGLTYVQRKEIDQFLGTVITKHPDGGVEYHNGESDKTLAKRFNCTLANVVYIREQVYGKLRAPETNTPEARLTRIERRVTGLEARIIGLEGMLDQLAPDWRQPSLDIEEPRHGN